MRKYRLLIVQLLIVLGGCSGLPEARVPLSPPGSEPYDQRILGSWLVEEQSTDIFYIHLKARSEPNMLDGTGIYMELRKSDLSKSNPPSIEWSTSIVHSSQVDGDTYYNIKRLTGIGNDYGAAEEKKGYNFIKANLVNDHTLKVCLMNYSNVGSAIEKGVLKGVLIKKDKSKNIKLDYYFMDVSKAELVKFIRDDKKGDLFRECLMFKKYSSSSTNTAR